MRSRYACLVVPRFLVTALLRGVPDLRGRPVAVVGRSPTMTVVDANTPARRTGVCPGMADAEAEARAPGLVLRARNLAAERSAQSALLDLALNVSPRVEDGGFGTVHVDLEGLAMLYRDEGRLAEDLASRVDEAFEESTVAIASTRTAARLAAMGRDETGDGGRVVVIPPGGEAAFLASLPIGLLVAPPDTEEVFFRWGLRTLGELAALPDTALAERLGKEGRRLQRVARGEDLAPFVPYRPPTRHEEAIDLEWPIDNLEALAFALGGVVDRLVARLTSCGWVIGALGLTLGLTDHSTREYALFLASPLADGRAITSLFLQRLRSDPPPAAIERMAVQAEPVRPRLAQGSLFAPASISPECVAATLARLEMLAGTGRVGSPALLDSHRPDAFRMNPFDGSCARSNEAMSRPLSRSPAGSPFPVLRRSRPSPDAIVETAPDGSPMKILSARVRGPVRLASGPWRSSGEWWMDTGWSCEEWDVELAGGHLIRLAFDRTRQAWSIEGVYD